MLGRSGYQMINFEGYTLSLESSVTVKGAFKKAKAGLPILIKGVTTGGNGLTCYTFDAAPNKSDEAWLSAYIMNQSNPVQAFLKITNNDGVTVII